MRRSLAATGLLALALIPAVRLLWLCRDAPHFGQFHDDGLYFVTAKSLAEGKGYRVASLPGEPHQTKYPPVLPVLLSVAWRMETQFPASLRAAVWLTWAALPILVVLTYQLFKELKVKFYIRLIVTALTAANPYLAYLGTAMMSEMWSTCFALATLILVNRSRKAAQPGWLAVAAGLMAAAGYLTRTSLVPLIPAAAWLLWRAGRGRALFPFLATTAPCAAAWHLWSASHRAPATDWTWLYYLDYTAFYRQDFSWSILPLMVYQNLNNFLIAGGELLLFKVSMVPWGEHLARLLMIAAMVGVMRWARSSRHWDYPLFAAGLCALLVVWNFPPNERFLIPMLPLLLVGLWTESIHLFEVARGAWRRPELSQRVAAVLTLLLLAGFTASFLARNLQAQWTLLPAFADEARRANRLSQPVEDWVRENTPAAASFFADRDAVLYLRTGRKATAFRIPVRHVYAEDSGAILAHYKTLPEFARARGLDYLLLTPRDFELDALPGRQREAVRQALGADPGFQKAYHSAAGDVVRAPKHVR